MPTKLSRYCEGVMEAAWLAAVLLIPVFFNIFSSRIFEPDKITILRSLSLVILAAWIIKLIDQRGSFWDRIQPGNTLFRYLLGFPLVFWAAALALVYFISTFFSVTQEISFWGSYQRLQGTYTTLSYLVIFSAVLGNMRRKDQVERLITTAIISTIPVSLYSFLQRYRLDPIPWSGDVSYRVAANAGNSIFVGAHLIMVFPLVLGRIIQSFQGIMNEKTPSVMGAHVVRGTIYVFVAAIQIIALYMTQSRGPALGWLAGLVLMALLLAYVWRKRWLTLSIAGLGAALIIFLIIFQLPSGPLEGLRRNPVIGRFGQILDPDSNSAKVRKYIWEGAAEMIAPHDPIVYPDGSRDTMNLLRPLIGYGPESMYVAFNQFYIPELGQVERRNASPDRSHNETWDSLVTTGVLGLVVYLGLFVSVFYYGLKWIGLVRDSRGRNLFLALCGAGGIAGAVGLALYRDVAYFGVGLPFGILGGMILYILIASVLYPRQNPVTSPEFTRLLLMIMLLTAIISHFIEINFGIAVVTTRLYFWIFTGMLVVLGLIMSAHRVFESEEAAAVETGVQKPVQAGTKSRRKRMDASNQAARAGFAWTREVAVGVAVTAMLLMTLGYNYISNTNHYTSVFVIFWNSLTRLPNHGNAVSYGILGLIATTWVFSACLWAAEIVKDNPKASWLRLLAVLLGAPLLIGLVFWLWHSGELVALETAKATNVAELIAQVDRVGGLLTTFYIFIFLVVFAFAYYLKNESVGRRHQDSFFAWFAGAGLTIVVLVLVYVTNLRIIHADIAFKMAEPFNRSTQWPVATLIYKHANRLAPDEDHYYLFLGRSYLEQAKEEEDQQQVVALVNEAENDLKVAQRINPLNTDHTANLARLYNWWAKIAGNAGDETLKNERAQTANRYFETALKLSPQNSTLYGEWALLLSQELGKPEEGLQKVEHALELDPQYVFTQGLAGDYWLSRSRQETDPNLRTTALEKAVQHYRMAVDSAKGSEKTQKITFLVSLGNAYIELDRLEEAISAFNEAIAADPGDDLWRIEETIAKLYLQLADEENALIHAQAALAASPSEQAERIQNLISQIRAAP